MIAQSENPPPVASSASPGRPVVAPVRVLAVAALASVCALPFCIDPYHTFQATAVIDYAIALMGLGLLVGRSGQISLGHGAFYAIGAYTSAILIDHCHVPYIATLPLVAGACFVAGFLFGLPALRLQGVYLALATFALAIAVPQMLTASVLDDWTGGVQGLSFAKPAVPLRLPLSPDRWMFFLSLAIALVLLVVAHRLGRGAVGRSLIALRDNPVAAVAMGIDVPLYKTLTFAVSAAYTGVAGALSALSLQFVAPDSFGGGLSISLLVGVIVGGPGSLAGTVFGALFIVFVPNVADSISKSATWAIYGFFLVGCVYLMPEGVAGALHAGLRRLRLDFGRRWRIPARRTPNRSERV